MSNFSTLIYFVNDFQTNLKAANSVAIDVDLESYLTAMGTVNAGPSEQTIKNILNFACSFEVLETKKAGSVEMNLN